MCAGICFDDEDEVLDQIVDLSFDPMALTHDCCWREICRVRGRNFSSVSASVWAELCRERGHAIQEYGRDADVW